MELSVSHLIINFVPGVFHKRRNKISTRETIFDQLEKFQPTLSERNHFDLEK